MWDKYTVLIAEDEDVNFFLLSEYLEPTGIKVLRAKNGAEVLEIVSHEEPHVILMDIKMPVMNGYEATHKLREINPNIPVLAQTAYTMSEDFERLKATKFQEILAKPINEQDLLFTLRKYIKED
ncbi:MAG TPA: response regulator [Bacteroidales bacterium]|nr:response regulator [Bacteroidales bacterium]